MLRLVVILFSVFFCLGMSAEDRPLVGRNVVGAIHSYKPGDKIQQRFTLYYNLSDIDIDPDFLDNRAQMDTIVRYLAKSPEIDSITVYSYSSPEGPVANNLKLAQKRADAAKRFILEHADRDLAVNVVPVAENWEGLIAEIEANYNRPDKETILGILKDTTISDDVREITLKKHKESYNHILKNHSARLRMATWVCVWVVPEPDPVPVPQRRIRPCPDIDTSAAYLVERMKVLPPPPPPEQPVDTAKPYIPALKTNLLYDLTTTLNFSAEFPIGDRFSIMVEDTFPWWTWGPNGNKYCYRIWEIGVEPRWWFGNRTDERLLGHFLGIYGKSGKYDFQNDKSICYQGEYWSSGLSYGYAMMLGRKLHLEFSLSVGFLQADYRHYQPDVNYEDLYIDRNKIGKISYIGPTKLAVTLVWPLDFRKKEKKD